ncbi:unnamed protein product, partial [Polarella glacialis]
MDMPDSPQSAGDVFFAVNAETEEDKTYAWQGSLPPDRPLQELAEAWGRSHGVPETAVGLEDSEGKQLDLAKSPSEHGWTSESKVDLYCFPIEDKFMEKELIQ